MLNYNIKTIPTLINYTTVSNSDLVCIHFVYKCFNRDGGLRENSVAMSCW